MYGNAAVLEMTFVGDKNGQIGLIMNHTHYTRVSDTPFIITRDLGMVPNIPETGVSDSLCEQLLEEHNVEQNIFNNCLNMDDTLKAQLIVAVDPVYLAEKKVWYLGYHGVSTRELIQHLMTCYGKTKTCYYDANKKSFEEPFDISQPIDAYYTRVDDSIQFADDADNPFTTIQILQTAYAAIYKSCYFMDACKEWRKNPEDEKNWDTFKTFFCDGVS